MIAQYLGSLIPWRQKKTPVQPPAVQPTIGCLIGPFGRSLCWEAKGAPRNLYQDTIGPQITAYLNDNFGCIPGDDHITISMYMTGDSVEKAAPTLLFISKNPNTRKEVRKTVKESGIMSRYQDFQVKYVSKDPGSINIEPLASSNMSLATPNTLAIDPNPIVPLDMWVCGCCDQGNLIEYYSICSCCGHARDNCCAEPGQSWPRQPRGYATEVLEEDFEESETIRRDSPLHPENLSNDLDSIKRPSRIMSSKKPSTPAPASIVLFDETQPFRTLGMPVYIRCGSTLRTATANVIKIGPSFFFQTAYHAFCDATPDLKTSTNSSDHELEIDSDVDSENGLIDDADVTITSAASQSPESSSDEAPSDGNDFSRRSSLFSKVATPTSEFLPGHPPSALQDKLAGLTFKRRLHEPKEITNPLEENLRFLGRLLLGSADHDLAIIEITDEKVLDRLWEHSPPKEEAPVAYEKIASGARAGTKVYTRTALDEELTGSISGTSSFVHLAGSSSFQEMYIVRCNGPLFNGICGSAIIDTHTGETYGHIVAGCRKTGVAYVVPATQALETFKNLWGSCSFESDQGRLQQTLWLLLFFSYRLWLAMHFWWQAMVACMSSCFNTIRVHNLKVAIHDFSCSCFSTLNMAICSSSPGPHRPRIKSRRAVFSAFLSYTGSIASMVLVCFTSTSYFTNTSGVVHLDDFSHYSLGDRANIHMAYVIAVPYEVLHCPSPLICSLTLASRTYITLVFVLRLYYLICISRDRFQPSIVIIVRVAACFAAIWSAATSSVFRLIRSSLLALNINPDGNYEVWILGAFCALSTMSSYSLRSSHRLVREILAVFSLTTFYGLLIHGLLEVNSTAIMYQKEPEKYLPGPLDRVPVHYRTVLMCAAICIGTTTVTKAIRIFLDPERIFGSLDPGFKTPSEMCENNDNVLVRYLHATYAWSSVLASRGDIGHRFASLRRQALECLTTILNALSPIRFPSFYSNIMVSLKFLMLLGVSFYGFIYAWNSHSPLPPTDASAPLKPVWDFEYLLPLTDAWNNYQLTSPLLLTHTSMGTWTPWQTLSPLHLKLIYWLILSMSVIIQPLRDLYTISCSDPNRWKADRSRRHYHSRYRAAQMDDLMIGIQQFSPDMTFSKLATTDSKRILPCLKVRSDLLRYQYWRLCLRLTGLCVGLYCSQFITYDSGTPPALKDVGPTISLIEHGGSVLIGCLLGAITVGSFECSILFCSNARIFSRALSDWRQQHYYPLIQGTSLVLSLQWFPQSQANEKSRLLATTAILIIPCVVIWIQRHQIPDSRLFESIFTDLMACGAILLSGATWIRSGVVSYPKPSESLGEPFTGLQLTFLVGFILNFITTVAVQYKPACIARCIDNWDYKRALEQLTAWRPLRRRLSPEDACRTLVHLHMTIWIEEMILVELLEGETRTRDDSLDPVNNECSQTAECECDGYRVCLDKVLTEAVITAAKSTGIPDRSINDVVFAAAARSAGFQTFSAKTYSQWEMRFKLNRRKHGSRYQHHRRQTTSSSKSSAEALAKDNASGNVRVGNGTRGKVTSTDELIKVDRLRTNTRAAQPRATYVEVDPNSASKSKDRDHDDSGFFMLFIVAGFSLIVWPYVMVSFGYPLVLVIASMSSVLALSFLGMFILRLLMRRRYPVAVKSLKEVDSQS